MKKYISLLLALVLCLSLCACGGGNNTENNNSSAEKEDTTKATVITNEGETVTMTADELIEIYDSNEAKFNKLYSGAKITFVGTISNIKVDTSVIVESGSVKAGQNKIVFEEGWSLVIGADNTTVDLADLDVGAVYEVTTSIVGAPFDTDFLKTVSDNNRVIWLVGNEKIHGEQFSSVTTKIAPPSDETADVVGNAA